MVPWYRSKQFWFNVLTAAVVVASAFGFADFAPDPRTLVIAQLVVAVINVILRFAIPSPAPDAAALPKGALPGAIWPAMGRHPAPDLTARRNLRAAMAFAVLATAAALSIGLTP